MRAFYSAETVANNFVTITTYQIGGRNVALIIGRENAFVISAIDAQPTERHGIDGHQILAVLEMAVHTVHDETQFSEAAYWQAEDFEDEAMHALMRANLAARCDIRLITGEELEAVRAEEARRLQMYKIMRQEPPEAIG